MEVGGNDAWLMWVGFDECEVVDTKIGEVLMDFRVGF
jgi:hypothetical protein